MCVYIYICIMIYMRAHIYIYIYRKIQKFGIAISFLQIGRPAAELPGSPLKEVKPVHVHSAGPPSPAPWEHGQYAAGSAAGTLDHKFAGYFWRFPTF